MYMYVYIKQAYRRLHNAHEQWIINFMPPQLKRSINTHNINNDLIHREIVDFLIWQWAPVYLRRLPPDWQTDEERHGQDTQGRDVLTRFVQGGGGGGAGRRWGRRRRERGSRSGGSMTWGFISLARWLRIRIGWFWFHTDEKSEMKNLHLNY